MKKVATVAAHCNQIIVTASSSAAAAAITCLAKQTRNRWIIPKTRQFRSFYGLIKR